MKAKIIASLKKALVNEIKIDFRACVYFFCVVFFYCAAKACQGVFRVDIITLVQIVLTNYVICYLQTYLFSDFDESDRFGASEISGILTCAFCYTASSLLFGWFGGSEPVTALFALYMVILSRKLKELPRN